MASYRPPRSNESVTCFDMSQIIGEHLLVCFADAGQAVDVRAPELRVVEESELASQLLGDGQLGSYEQLVVKLAWQSRVDKDGRWQCGLGQMLDRALLCKAQGGEEQFAHVAWSEVEAEVDGAVKQHEGVDHEFVAKVMALRDDGEHGEQLADDRAGRRSFSWLASNYLRGRR